jgi:hypothetical protein
MTQVAQHHAFSANSAMSELLNKELKLDGAYHPNLGGVSRGGMANHYPMTIISMHELGASDQQINNFRQQWPRNRALIDETLGLVDRHELTSQNWHLYLGQSQRLKEFRRVFYQQFTEQFSKKIIEGESAASHVKTDVITAVITAALQKMQDGLPMGLFHPLIRLSFAALQGDKGLLADALAYMAIRYRDVYQSQQLQAGKPNLSYGGSIHVCEQLCSYSFVHAQAQNSSNPISANNLKSTMARICKAATQLYLIKPSLSTLHGVTASQGLVDLTLRFATNDHSKTVFAGLWQRYWIWLTALSIEKDCTETISTLEDAHEASNKIDQEQEVNWQDLADKALGTNEVHIIKMVYSCKWLFEQIDADPLYYQAAKTML